MQLEAVAVRIVEVERFADAVVRRAVERHVRLDRPPQRVTERGTVGWIAT